MADFRKLVLKLLLAALALAALGGAATVLMSGNTMAWRIVGTALVTAAAAGLMIPLSILGDKEQTRSAGVFGIALVVVEYLLALAMIWEVELNFFSSSHAFEDLALMMVWVFVCGAPAIRFLSVLHKPGSVLAGWVGICIAGGAFFLFFIGTFSHGTSNETWKWFGSAFSLGGLGLLAVACLIGTENRWWTWIGVGASGLAILMSTYAIWNNVHSDNVAFAIVVSIAAVIAHANLSLLAPLSPGQQWIRIVTIIAAIACAAFVDAIVASKRTYNMHSPIDNLAGATGIIAGCGSLALVVIARLNRPVNRTSASPELREITIFCPMCQKKQAMAIGQSPDAPAAPCVQCGLRIKIHVDMPRCAKCDYLLVMINSDRCPECGTPVSAPAPVAS